MNERRNIIIVLIALALGLAAVYIANAYLSGVERQTEQTAEDNRRVQIAVARVPLNYGEAITVDKVRMAAWPASSLPPGAFQDLQALTQTGDKQRVVLRPVAVGEPLLSSKVSGEGGRASISAILPENKRAVAVRINDVAGVAGFVLPGDTVDVMITRTLPEEEGGNNRNNQITDLLLQGKRVIAVDQNASDTADQPQVGKTVTLEVDPIEAQKLALGGQIGTLSLALRNVADKDPPLLATVSLDDLRADLFPGGIRPTSGAVPRYTGGSSGGATIRRRVRRSGGTSRPRPSPTVAVQVGKGTEVTTVEVKRHGGN